MCFPAVLPYGDAQRQFRGNAGISQHQVGPYLGGSWRRPPGRAAFPAPLPVHFFRGQSWQNGNGPGGQYLFNAVHRLIHSECAFVKIQGVVIQMAGTELGVQGAGNAARQIGHVHSFPVGGQCHAHQLRRVRESADVGGKSRIPPLMSISPLWCGNCQPAMAWTIFHCPGARACKSCPGASHPSPGWSLPGRHPRS